MEQTQIIFSRTKFINYFRNISHPMDCLTVPRHLVVSQGRVYPKTDSAIKNYTPKQIQYKHTIRVITPFSCSHEEDIKRMQIEHEEKMQTKEKEIEMVRMELKEKTKQIERKNEELQKLRLNISSKQYHSNIMKTSIMENKFEKSQVTDIFKSRIDHSCFSNIKTSFIFDLNSNQQESKQTHKLEDELQNMQNNLKDLSDALSKPKKNYQFFFTRIKPQTIPVIPSKVEKLNEVKTDITCSNFLQQQDDNFESDESMDHTSTNQSFDATDFLEQAIQDHKVLRDTLIELQRSTKSEMQQMKKYYEGEIEGYKRVIEQQRQKSKVSNNKMGQMERRHEYHQREKQFGSILRGLANNENASCVLDND